MTTDDDATASPRHPRLLEGNRGMGPRHTYTVIDPDTGKIDRGIFGDQATDVQGLDTAGLPERSEQRVLKLRPNIDRPAAFFCAQGRCSLPVLTPLAGAT